MEVRSADEANALLTTKLNTLAEDNKIAKEAIPIIKEALNESTEAGKTKADAANIQAYINDKEFYRGVLLILGAAVIIATIGGLALTFNSKDVPQFIVAIGTTALGAIAGLLAPSPTQGK
ncbi:MAG: hypothetical protein WB392_05635 [Methanotrichaceae archaeon]